VKTSLWALAVIGTSVAAASGCLQTARVSDPFATSAQQAQAKFPVANDGGTAALAVGMNCGQERIIVVADPLLPSAGLPGPVMLPPPPPLPQAATPMPTLLPPLPPLPRAADLGNSSGPSPTMLAANASGRLKAENVAFGPSTLPSPDVPSLWRSGTPPALSPVVVTVVPMSVPQKQGFSHSDDYQLLTGQVQSFRGNWRLRYADYASVDAYGGSVILEGGSLDKLQDGCQVRVQGRLIPPANRASPARFQVQSVDVTGQ
jgi:hypothetical protein